MKSNKLLIVITIAVSSYFFTGCFGVDAKFYKIKKSVMNHIPESYYTDVELGIGSVGLSLAKIAIKFNNDHDVREARKVLSEITKVQVGVYKQNGSDKIKNIRTFLNEVASDLYNEGWVNIVKNIDRDEMTSIYLRPNAGNEIRELLVINFERNELVIANVEGNFSQALASVIGSEKMHIEM